jgi:4-hydroxy-2-oxoheptanedioate aldolase
VKIENLKDFKNYKKVLSVPGISFAEWGPGDMGMALGYREKHDPPYPKKMLYIKKQIQKECKKKSIYFLNAVYSKKEMLTNLDEGVKFMRIPDSDKAGLLANFGRKKWLKQSN